MFGFTVTETIFGAGVALEMIIANLITLDKCSERRYGKGISGLILGAFTALIIVLATALLRSFSGAFVHKGNGVLMLVGWFYLIPCSIVYKDNVKKLVAKISIIWTFTFSVFSVAVSVAKLFEIEFVMAMFAAQTILWVLLWYPLLKMVKEKFVVLLNETDGKMHWVLICNGFVWMSLAVVCNLATVYPDISSVYVAMALLLVGGATGFCFTLFETAAYKDRTNRLELQVRTDMLTGLGNRQALFSDGQKLVDEMKPFTLIFMDINHLKNLNDAFGHIYGDNYLQLFAKRAVKSVGEDGMMYRISGDEFICIFTGEDPKPFVKSLHADGENSLTEDIVYYGCGVGCSFYPNDGETIDRLIGVADGRMYADKEETKPLFF